MYGNPARQHGWVDKRGNKLVAMDNSRWVSEDGEIFIESEVGLQIADEPTAQ
jgi:hypothetical protein